MDVLQTIEEVGTGAKDVVSTVTGFIGHYAQEIDAVGSVLNSILHALPINAADKANIQAKVDTVTGAVDNISKALDNFATNPPVVEIKASDLTAAVDAFLSTDAFNAHVAALVAAEVAKANPPAAGAAS